MNLFEHELKMMFDDTDIIKDVKICGKTLLGKLDDELRIRPEPSNSHVASHSIHRFRRKQRNLTIPWMLLLPTKQALRGPR